MKARLAETKGLTVAQLEKAENVGLEFLEALRTRESATAGASKEAD